MKLRNKKTGKVQTCDFAVISDDYRKDCELATLNDHIFIFRSIKQLNDEYEDYKPKKPLIKDEKIRKAVRTWAEANRDVSEVIYDFDPNKVYCELVDNQSEARIRFNFLFIKELNAYELYTIDELCGEKEQ